MSEYPENWKTIAASVKMENGQQCERCGHSHEIESRHVLTVHHLIPDKSLCEPWNLAALCQRCHLKIQSRLDLHQMVFGFHEFEKWLKPHREGYLKYMSERLSE